MSPKVSSSSYQFISDIIWVTLSQLFTSLFGIITLPVLTKTFTSEIYGVWTQVNVTVGLLINVVTLQFVTAVVRFLAGEEDNAVRRRSIGTMLYPIVIFICLILVAGKIWASQISLFLFNDPAYGDFVSLTFFWACADGLFAFFISYLRARGRMKKLSVIQAILGALKMVLIVVLVLSGLTLQSVVFGIVLLDLVFILYVFYPIIREDGFPIPNFTGLKTFLAFSLPQIPVSILSWIMSASDRYFITHFISLSETGIYSSSTSLAGFINLFYSPIAYVLFPVVSKSWEQNKKNDTKLYFEYSTRLFLTLAIPAAVGLAMISQQLLKILATSEYLAGISLVLLLGINQIFIGIFTINNYIIYLVKQTKWLPMLMLLSTGISVVLNILLIPSMGIIGAAISKIIAYFVLAVIVTIWVRNRLKYNIDFIYLSKVIIASAGMALCLHFLKLNGIIGITLSIISGLAVFIILLFVMKGFTKQDRQFIKDLLNRNRE